MANQQVKDARNYHIIKFLNGKHHATTHEIYEHVNGRCKHGVTMAIH